MLIETVARGAGRVAVIGIGINLREQRVAAASTGVAWLGEIDAAAAASPQVIAERLVPTLTAALRRFENDGFPAFAVAFANRDLLRGRAVRWAAATGFGREGIASGISAGGELRCARQPASSRSAAARSACVPNPARPPATQRSASDPC